MFFNLISCCYNEPITCEETLLYLLCETAGCAKSLLDEKQKNVDYMQKEIGQLLLRGQEKRARLKVVEFIDDKNLSWVLEIIIPFFRLIARRLPSIESEREIPPDMKEAIATLCFVGTRYGEIRNLLELRSHLCSKYGEEYIVNLTKCNKPDCCVNKKIIKLLLLPNPTENEINKVLRKIAMKSKIKDWHPGYKCSFQNFDEDLSKKCQPRWGYTYTDHNFVDEITSSSSSSSSASASPKSVSHDNLEIVPARWNKV